MIAGILADGFKRWLKHKEKMAEALSAVTAEKAAQYAAHNERLEQRVRVLERIVTDKGIEVADEIVSGLHQSRRFRYSPGFWAVVTAALRRGIGGLDREWSWRNL